MELVELYLMNFRRFAERDLRFSPGLNLVWGPNEAGKSTIHEAISCALFGRDRGKAIENWAGGACQVRLDYRSDGKQYSLERRFSEARHHLGTLRNGELVDVITDKDALEAAVAEHLGIADKDVFENSVSVRQMEISKLSGRDLAVVGHEIQRVLTGTAQVSASQVLTNLRNRQSEIMGRARPKKPREYDTVSERLQKAAESLAEARKSRDRIQGIEQETEVLEEKIGRESERLTVVGELLTRHRRWAELRQRQQEMERLHSSVFATVRKLDEALQDLTVAQKELMEHADLVGKADEIADQLAKLSARRAELEERLQGFEGVMQTVSTHAEGLTSKAWLIGAVLTAAIGAVLGLLTSRWLFLLLVPAAALAVKAAAQWVSRGHGENRHIARLCDSAREELKQVQAEEESVLRYVNCEDRDQAWASIKAYRSLVTRVHELEIAIDALLAGRRLDDWHNQEAELARDSSAVGRELEEAFPGYSPATEESEGWRSEHASLQASISSAQNRLHELRGELEAERRNVRDLACLEGEIEYLHRRKSELEFTHKAYGEAIAALQAAVQHVSEEYLPTLSERATECLHRITAERYTAIGLTPDWEITLDCTERSAIPQSAVSAGTLDQLYLSLRIACGELLSSGRKLPTILDDPFTSFDRNRLDRSLLLVRELAKENQILLLTHDPYILDWAKNTDCTIHMLP